MTTTNETAGVKPASDEEIFARLKELGARATEIVGVPCVAGVYISQIGGSPLWSVNTNGSAFGYNSTFEGACADVVSRMKQAQRRAAIEARVRAELEATA